MIKVLFSLLDKPKKCFLSNGHFLTSVMHGLLTSLLPFYLPTTLKTLPPPPTWVGGATFLGRKLRVDTAWSTPPPFCCNNGRGGGQQFSDNFGQWRLEFSSSAAADARGGATVKEPVIYHLLSPRKAQAKAARDQETEIATCCKLGLLFGWGRGTGTAGGRKTIRRNYFLCTCHSCC